jgi:hypothetical protein
MSLRDLTAVDSRPVSRCVCRVRRCFGDVVAVGVAIDFHGVGSGVGDQCHAFRFGEGPIK